MGSVNMQTLADFDEKTMARNGYIGLVGSIIFFQVINKIVRYVGPPKSCTDRNFWKWKNLLISWFHALIVGTWTLLCLIIYPEMWSDLVNHFTILSYSLVVFSTGYFLYDFCDMLVHNKIFKLWELTLHHIAVGITFIYNTFYLTCVGFTCVALLAETNSIFLHSRKLMQMHGFSFDHPVYRANAVVNLVTFVLGRGTALYSITYSLIYTPNLVSPFYYWLLSLSMFIMNSIHPVLFWRLLNNDFIKPWKLSRKQESKRSTPESNGKHLSNGINGFINNNDKKFG